VECEVKGRAKTERPPEKGFRRAQGVELRERRGRRRRRGTAGSGPKKRRWRLRLDVALCLSAVRYDFSSVLFFQKLNRVIWCCVSVSSFSFAVAAWSFASEPSSFVTMLH
jgi:hypothetical protein